MVVAVYWWLLWQFIGNCCGSVLMVVVAMWWWLFCKLGVDDSSDGVETVVVM